MSVMLYPCILCVALSMDLSVLCVACFVVVAVLLMNVMEVFNDTALTPNDTAMAPNDIAYKRWNCHSGYKLLCKLCRNLPS